MKVVDIEIPKGYEYYDTYNTEDAAREHGRVMERSGFYDVILLKAKGGMFKLYKRYKEKNEWNTR